MGGAGDPEPATEPDRNGPAGGATPWSRGRPRGRPNGTRATAAVTRCGCRRGATLRRVRTAPRGAPATSRDPRAPDAADAKRGEPQDRERDATSPQPPRGGTRRGGEKPRGRHEMSTAGSVDPNRAPARGSRRAAGHPMEGREKRTNPTRGRYEAGGISGSRSCAPTGRGSSEGEAKGREVDSDGFARRRRRQRQVLEGPAGDGQGRGGRAGKANQPHRCRRRDPAHRTGFRTVQGPTDHEAQPTPREPARRMRIRGAPRSGPIL
jgi:hypothetical protein